MCEWQVQIFKLAEQDLQVQNLLWDEKRVALDLQTFQQTQETADLKEKFQENERLWSLKTNETTRVEIEEKKLVDMIHETQMIDLD